MQEDLAKIRHERSVKDFPGIDLGEGEYVELAINRSKWGLILIWAGEVIGFAVLTVVLILLTIGSRSAEGLFGLNEAAQGYLFLLVFALYGVLVVSGLVGTFIYKNNNLVITNKRVFQRTRANLLANSINIIDLQSIEDVSFHKSGLFDYVFHMGTIRMATVGDETTYTFPYADTPRDEINIIAGLVHKAKTSRGRKGKKVVQEKVSPSNDDDDLVTNV